MNPLETKFYKILKRNRRLKSVKYETKRLPYLLEKTYIPDFLVVTKDGNREIYIETKGYLRPADRTKMIAVKKANPDLDIRIVFAKDNTLGRGSKTRYSEWAKKHGFKYSVGAIPKDWFTDSIFE